MQCAQKSKRIRLISIVDNAAMYIIAIGWLYVTLLVALTESSIFAGILSFVFYGLAPTALLLWLSASPSRRRRSNAIAEAELQLPSRPERGDAKLDP